MEHIHKEGQGRGCSIQAPLRPDGGPTNAQQGHATATSSASPREASCYHCCRERGQREQANAFPACLLTVASWYRVESWMARWFTKMKNEAQFSFCACSFQRVHFCNTNGESVALQMPSLLNFQNLSVAIQIPSPLLVEPSVAGGESNLVTRRFSVASVESVAG